MKEYVMIEGKVFRAKVHIDDLRRKEIEQLYGVTYVSSITKVLNEEESKIYIFKPVKK